MIYRFLITTPANTSEKDAQQTEMKLGKGVIHKLDIVFPPGPQRLLHLKIAQGAHQRWPTNPDQSFASDGEPITFREGLELNEEPYILSAWTWNEDTVYEHAVIIRLGLLRKKYIMPWLQTWTEKMRFTEE